jgi:hypothetical protein
VAVAASLRKAGDEGPNPFISCTAPCPKSLPTNRTPDIVTAHQEVESIYSEIEAGDESRRDLVEHVITERARHSVAEEQYLRVTVTLPDGGIDQYMRFGAVYLEDTTARSTSSGVASDRHTATHPAGGPV